jgi:GNAT superfamily N-acetyltransferase
VSGCAEPLPTVPERRAGAVEVRGEAVSSLQGVRVPQMAGTLTATEVGDELSGRLVGFLRETLGVWPPAEEFVVSSSPARATPGWDGDLRPFAGLESPGGTVVSVPPSALEEARELALGGRAAFEAGIGAILGRPSAELRRGVFRACRALVDLGEPGIWLPSSDRRLPEWLAAFPGEVLVVLDGEGRYAAGVGLKRHSALGQEIAVGTEPEQRGRGLARAIVAQAARRVFEEGAVATYLHDPANLASGKVAEAAGFPDLSWRVLGLSGGELA